MVFMVIMRDQYILGKIRESGNAILDIGRFYALDSSLGSNIAIDISKPHIILISGKRGYGKSYTMGVLIEELSNLKQKIYGNISIIIIDTLGIFWTLAIPNNREEKLLESWGLKTKTFNLTIYTSQKDIPFYRSLGITVKPLILKPSQFSIDQWYHIFDIKSTDPFGMILTKAILNLDSDFDLSDIEEWIQNSDIDEHTKGVAENFISLAESWKIFSKNGLEINDLLIDDNIVIIDLSGISDNNLKTGVASFIGDKIFDIQVEKRKQYELYQIGRIDDKPDVSLVWLAIDEAQLFIPRNENKLGRRVFIEKWLRQGRQPGLSMILATQHPSLIDQEVLSHCDIILCHRLTSQNDIDSLSKLRPTYMTEEIKDSMKKIGIERGVTLVIDDISESTHIIKIRPRYSWHGGGEPSIPTRGDEIIEETRYSSS